MAMSTRNLRFEVANAEVRPRDEVIAPPAGDRVVNLGARLREVRLKSGLSLRAVARGLGVSPSFVSQIENDRSRPSVATLYSFAQLLDVSMDRLFEPDDDSAQPPSSAPAKAAATPTGVTPINRSDLGSPADAWEVDPASRHISITAPGSRSRLVMDCGVVWEQLASSAGHGVDFMEIIYPPGSSSTNDGRMLRHAGYECGYLLTGELEITVGFESAIVHSGEAIGFDSSVPHLLRNPGSVPAHGIWCVFH